MHPSFFMKSEEDVLQWAYGEDQLSPKNIEAIRDTCLLCPLNSVALEINETVSTASVMRLKHSFQVLDMLPGPVHDMRGIDTCSKENSSFQFPTELYNKQTPSGIPPFNLRLKKVGETGTCCSHQETRLRDVSSFY